MNSDHFDGIIEAAGVRIGAESYGVLAETFGLLPDGNARRLAAAWNLCQGIDTETLEALGVGALAIDFGVKPGARVKPRPRIVGSPD